jgi:hypothetical protein
VPGLFLSADCLALGAYLAHNTRWAAVGNRVMSTPISAISSCAPCRPDAADVIELGYLAGERGDHLLNPPGQRLELGARLVRQHAG